MQSAMTPLRLFQSVASTIGPCDSRTQYVWRWNLRPGLDIAIERRGFAGKMWLPWPGTDFGIGRRRLPGDRVNSNVYHKAPSLARGDLLELRIATDAELAVVLNYLRSRVGTVAPAGSSRGGPESTAA